MDHIALGKRGEELARAYMIEHNYQLLEQNYRWKRDEIDLIFAQGDELIIVEVKTRSSATFQEPQLAVSRSKQRHLIRATNAYILENQCNLDVRFDVISIVLNGHALEINHIPNAFYPTL